MNSAKKNNQSLRSVPGDSLERVGICHAWTNCFFSVLADGQSYGAYGIVVGCPNLFNSLGVVSLIVILCNIFNGIEGSMNGCPNNDHVQRNVQFATLEKFFDVAKQMHKTFLLGERINLVPVSTVKITDQNAILASPLISKEEY